MSILHVFACSYGKFGNIDEIEWRDQGSFGYILARKLKKHLHNHSLPGNNNFGIFKRVINVLPSLSLNDMLIINWSHIDRVHLRDSTKFGPSMVPTMSWPNKKACEDYYRYCYDDFQSLSNLITFTHYIKSQSICPVIYSVSEPLELYQKIHLPYVDQLIQDSHFVYDKDKFETPLVTIRHSPLKFPCYHATQEGHQYIAEQFYSKIQSIGYI